MSMTDSRMPDDVSFQRRLYQRQARGRRWQMIFLSAILLGLLVLVVLLMSILNQTFGLIAVKESIPPAQLASRPLEELSALDLALVLRDHLSKGRMQALLLQELLGSDVDRARLTTDPIHAFIPGGKSGAAGVGDKKFADLSVDEIVALVAANVPQNRLLTLVYEQVVGHKILQSWSLVASLFNRGVIEREVADKIQGIGLTPTLSDKQRAELIADYTAARLEWHSWLGQDLFTHSMSQTPADAGIRGAVTGTLWVLLFALGFSVPLGVGAALYLEEYAKDNIARHKVLRWFNQFVETNIRNLAGVPSIIYGLLGLTLFARILEPITSGRIFGGGGPNGRTILTAGLTLGLLILPVIIINAQEAIRAVPYSIREASYGLGATRWQTVRWQVIPAAIPGIMTGIILSLSRAIGESAPLIVVGAAVFLSRDPNGPFTPFTTLPIQIYNWASMPDDQFRNLGSAAIMVLLALLLLLNATAIILRQRFSRKLQ